MADIDISQEPMENQEVIDVQEEYESSDMNFLDELPKEFLDTIAPAIYALPERIRNEEEGKYIFPEEYHNKIYRFNNKFLLFNSTSFEEVSYSTVSFVLKLCHLFAPDHSTMENITEGSEQLQILVKDSFVQIQKLQEAVNLLDNKITLTDEKVKTIDEKPTSSGSDPDLNKIKTELREALDNYVQTNTDIINKFESQETVIKNLETKVQQLEEFIKESAKQEAIFTNPESILNNEELINKIGTIIWNKLQNGDQDYLNVSLFNQFKEHVETQLSILHNKTLINNNKPETRTHIDDGIPLSEVMKQFQVVPTHILIQLKLAGFTSEEIIQLREKGALGEWDYK